MTPWFTMDPDRAHEFEKGTYLDAYPHPYGGGGGYGEDLMEGYHLLGMFDYLLNHVLWSGGPWIAWNYGLDRVRFTSVIRRSDPFRLSGTVTEVVPRGDRRHLLVLDLTGQVRGRDEPGFVATQRLLWAAYHPLTRKRDRVRHRQDQPEPAPSRAGGDDDPAGARLRRHRVAVTGGTVLRPLT